MFLLNLVGRNSSSSSRDVKAVVTNIHMQTLLMMLVLEGDGAEVADLDSVEALVLKGEGEGEDAAAVAGGRRSGRSVTLTGNGAGNG